MQVKFFLQGKSMKRNLSKEIVKRIKEYPKFYQKVWLAVMEIPFGEIRSYKWVAKKIRKKNSVRAVGNALNKNPFSPTIPCHRVIRSDFTIGGFSKGIRNKVKLLRREGVKVVRIGKRLKVEK